MKLLNWQFVSLLSWNQGLILIFKILGHGAQNGIFARKTIPKACRFGPAEGLEHRLNSIEDIIDDDELSLVVLNDDGSIVKLGTDI